MCQINIFSAFCLLTLNAFINTMHINQGVICGKSVLKGVNQGNIQSVA